MILLNKIKEEHQIIYKEVFNQASKSFQNLQVN